MPNGRWLKANFNNILETTYTVSGLTEDVTYEFRVFARNSAGAVSAPSQQSEPITCRDDIEEPRLDVDASYSSNVVVMAGEIFKLEASVTGRPIPSLVWTKEGKELEDTAKLEIKTSDFHTTLTNKDSLRRDGGAFTLTASNPVCAINKIGVGEHADVPGKILLEEKLEPPDLELDADMRKMINIRAACTLRLFVPVRGRPAPEIKWGKADGEIKETAQIDNTGNYASLVIENVDRFDSGKYTLTAENASGVKSVFISVRVLDSPSPPTNFMVKEITKNSVTLTWEPPLLDVEMAPKDSDTWSLCASVKSLETTVASLLQGEEYQFRVVAVNDKGKSDPRQLAHSVVAKDLTIEPSIRPKASTYSVQVGYDLKIEVPIAGHPKPTITWTKDGAALKQTTRVNIKNTDCKAILVVKDAIRVDGGQYTLVLTNVAGTKTQFYKYRSMFSL
uniref:Titin n=1 Tax=Oryzias latipes TaxID=8090 RepID=A0A3P9HGQ5_ORYLA